MLSLKLSFKAIIINQGMCGLIAKNKNIIYFYFTLLFFFIQFYYDSNNNYTGTLTSAKIIKVLIMTLS